METQVNRRTALASVFGGGVGGLVLLVAGCRQAGPEIGRVTGRVSLNGEPTAGLMVEFQPTESGSPSIGYTDDSGRYELQFTQHRWGAMLGPHAVKIDWDYDPGSEEPPPPLKIPDRYHRATELRAEVESGSNTFDFDLEVPPKTRKSS